MKDKGEKQTPLHQLPGRRLSEVTLNPGAQEMMEGDSPKESTQVLNQDSHPFQEDPGCFEKQRSDVNSRV